MKRDVILKFIDVSPDEAWRLLPGKTSINLRITSLCILPAEHQNKKNTEVDEKVNGDVIYKILILGMFSALEEEFKKLLLKK